MSQRTIVVLTDGDIELARAIDDLRRRGHRVLATARPYEAIRWLLKSKARVFVVRAALIPDDGKKYLDEVRMVAGDAAVLWVSSEEISTECHRLVHETIGDGYRSKEIVDVVLRYLESSDAAGEVALRAGSQSRIVVGAALPRTERRQDTGSLARIFDVVTACRLLTEQEDEVDALVRRALDLFVDLTASQRVSIMMKCRETGRLKMVGRIGFTSAADSQFEAAAGEGIAGRVLTAEKPLLCSNTSKSDLATARKDYQGTSFLVVPILHRQSAVGVVNMTNRSIEGPYSDEDLIYALMLADQFGANWINATTISALRTMTVVDPLTDLYNRRHFDSELKREVERARRYGRALTLALVDVDEFKELNDRCGYTVADAVLRALARILRANFREVDIVTRWGGDEFAVILPETGQTERPAEPRLDPRYCIERVRQTIERIDLASIVPEGFGRVTVSIGVATFPTDCSTDAEIFERATAALHSAKRDGGNRTRFFK